MKAEAKNINLKFQVEESEKQTYGNIITLNYAESISKLFKGKMVLYLPKEQEIDVLNLHGKNISIEIQIRENHENTFTSRRFISGIITSVNILDYYHPEESLLQKNQNFLQKMKETSWWKIGGHALSSTIPGMALAKVLTECALDKNIAGANDGTRSSIIEQFACNYFCYELTIEPKLYLLSLSQALNRVFYKDEGINLIDDVIKVILDKYNIEADLKTIEGKDKMQVKSCVQYNETDLEFIERVLTSCNLCYYFIHKQDRHAIVISNNSYLNKCQKIQHGKDSLNKFTDYFNQITVGYNSVSMQNAFSNQVNDLAQNVESTIISNNHSGDFSNNDSNHEESIKYNDLIKGQVFPEILITREGSAPAAVVGGILNLDGESFNKYKNKNYLIYQNTIQISEAKYITYEDARLRDEITELKKLEQNPSSIDEEANQTHLENLLDLGKQSKLVINQELIGIKQGSLCTPCKIAATKNALIVEHAAIICEDKIQNQKNFNDFLNKGYIYVKLLSWDDKHSKVKAFLSTPTNASLKPGNKVNVRFVQKNESEEIAFISNLPLLL